MIKLFIEIITRSNETILININKIAFVTSDKKGVTICDLDGDYWATKENYDSFKARLNKITNIIS